MSEESNFDMKNIEKIIGNLPDNFMDILGGLGKKNSEESEKNSVFNGKNLEILMNLKNVLDKVDGTRDDKIELFRALKPFLRPARQNKITQCIKLFRLSKIAKEGFSLLKSDKEK